MELRLTQYPPIRTPLSEQRIDFVAFSLGFTGCVELYIFSVKKLRPNRPCRAYAAKVSKWFES